MFRFFIRTLAAVFVTLTFANSSGQAQSATEAYFVWRHPLRPETFVFKLTDPEKIAQAQDLIRTGRQTVVSGTIIKQPVYYNPGWSFHFDPKSINFVDAAIELCDAPVTLIESDLDNAWPHWCPWTSLLVSQVSPLPPGGENIKPTVSMTDPYRNFSKIDTAPANARLQANADDPDGTISKVEFFSQSQKIGEATSYPYVINWTNVPPGNLSVYAVATDDQGAVTTSKTVIFTINQPSSGNLLDGTDFFVRQHYRDFLNREPDEPGLAFWKNNIDICGPDLVCREVKRVDTSASFFLSIEFRETGYLVHRFYWASFGRRPLLAEFLPDQQLVGREVVVHRPGWEQVLENNKRAFADSWVQRPSFSAIFDTLGNAEFVDRLLANTGASFDRAERDALVNALNSSARTRAEVLREVAENPVFQRSEFSPAFVEMQYFGYLRRNPQDPPDGNLDGFNFWLNKLNQFEGDYRQAEMIKAFLTSIEYRRRFGMQ
jgi:hypothetical protein